MDINSLTIGDLRQIKKLLADDAVRAVSDANAPHPFVGKYVICRCSAAGVHAGVLESVNGDWVILRDSRRLWSWKAKTGIALSGVAQHGITTGSKVDVPNPQIALTGVCEIIPCSDDARSSIHEYKS